MTDTWNPALYDRFKEQRTRPALDLIALVQYRPLMRVVDLGCGTGEITARLHDELDAGETIGIDRSAAMLAQAAPRATSKLRFESADIAGYTPPGPVDLLFSNAALQWVDDHPALLARFRQWLAPHGQVAIQVPCADRHPSHAVMHKLAEKYGTGMLYQGHSRVLSAEAYAQLLFDLGFRKQQVVTRVYGHVLADVDEMVAFFDSTLLNPWKAALGEAGYSAFRAEYRDALVRELGDHKPMFFPMARTLLWGQLS